MKQVTIIGLGMIGSSMGMAIRAARKGVRVVGYDADTGVHGRAEKIGAVDKAEWRLDRAVHDADVVVLAVPVLQIPDLLEAISPHLQGGAGITDTATTKKRVMDWADEKLPREVGFIGGNPLAGGGLSGQDSARADLFINTQYPLMPAIRAPEAAVRNVVDFVQMLGATPLFVGVEEHDSYIAAVSNMPALLSNALVLANSASPSWREIGKFASDEFRDISRLAAVDPDITYGICSTNPEMVDHWLGAVIDQLNALRAAIQDPHRDAEGSVLRTRLQAASDARLKWTAGVSPDTEMPGDNLPGPGDGMGQIFFGGAIWDRMKRAGKGSDSDPRNSRNSRN